MGGITTFMTMAYIVIVNPGILAAAGMDKDAVMMATCLATALTTIVMGLFARYPIALAPGMGLNAFFAFEICGAYKVPWPVALGMVFLSGFLFLSLGFFRVRTMLIGVIPDSLKHAIAAGIGLFIAFIGLQHAGLVVKDEVTLVRIGDLSSVPVLISIASLAAVTAMLAAGVRGAVLHGIFIAGGLGLLFGEIKPENMTVPTLLPFQWGAVVLLAVLALSWVGFRLLKRKSPLVLAALVTIVAGIVAGWIRFRPGAVISWPPSMAPTAFKLDIVGVFAHWEWVALCFVFLFFDLFDTVGTLVGVSEQAGFMKDGQLARAPQAFASDAIGTVIGSLAGTSTVTSYIESAAGVAAGARTGFANLITAALFLLAMFFSPLVGMLAVGMVTAPALIVVGGMMMASVAKVPWRDPAEAAPAFLTMILMPLTFSISRGLTAGFILYPLTQLAAGRGRQVHPFLYVLGGLLLVGVALSFIFM
jgi:AGZA family xanthine/uracil permease-like MFS transporter